MRGSVRHWNGRSKTEAQYAHSLPAHDGKAWAEFFSFAVFDSTALGHTVTCSVKGRNTQNGVPGKIFCTFCKEYGKLTLLITA